MSPGHHLLSAAVWSWGNAWAFVADRVVWSLPVALAAAVIVGILSRGDNSHPSLWHRVKYGLIAAILSPISVMVAIFLYYFVIAYPVDSENKIIARIDALGKKQDSKISEISRRLDDIERLLQLGICAEQLGKIVDTNALQRAIDAVNQEIVGKSLQIPHLGGARGVWNDLIEQITVIAKRCYPGTSVELKLDPKPEQLDQKAPAEPEMTSTNIDEIMRFRRFYIQSRFASQKVEVLRNTIMQDIDSLKNRIANAAH